MILYLLLIWCLFLSIRLPVFWREIFWQRRKALSLQRPRAAAIGSLCLKIGGLSFRKPGRHRVLAVQVVPQKTLKVMESSGQQSVRQVFFLTVCAAGSVCYVSSPWASAWLCPGSSRPDIEKRPVACYERSQRTYHFRVAMRLRWAAVL